MLKFKYSVLAEYSVKVPGENHYLLQIKTLQMYLKKILFYAHIKRNILPGISIDHLHEHHLEELLV